MKLIKFQNFYLGALITLLVLFMMYGHSNRIEGDTVALLIGVNNAVKCLGNNIYFACPENVIHFPVFQYLIAIPLKLLGYLDENIFFAFLTLSKIAFIASLYLYFLAGKKIYGFCGGCLLVMVVSSGYLTWYATSTFNESVSFFLFSLLGYLLICKANVFKVGLVVLACTLTKEIAFPIIIYIFLLSLFYEKLVENKSAKKYLIKYYSLCVYLLTGLVINFLFNYFRFGVYFNSFNLDPQLMVSFKESLQYWLYLLVSPNFGLLFVWPSLIAFIFLGIFSNLKCSNKNILLFLCLNVGGVFLVNLGLSRWYSPFGWMAWGPRLTLPYIGSFFLLFASASLKDMLNYLSRYKAQHISIMFFIVFSFSFLANIAAYLDPGVMLEAIFRPTKIIINSGIVPFAVQTVPHDIFIAGLLEMMRESSLFATSLTIFSNDNLYYLTIFIVVLALICVLMGRSINLSCRNKSNYSDE